MFGKKKSEEIKLIIEQAKEDRNLIVQQMHEDRQIINEQLISLQRINPSFANSYGKSIDIIDKRKAAYALNLCTVSVSQIIDYNDIYVLEQEYEAILNNLNLEKIIKDEELLNTLKLLLDTITFFRIQEKEKEFVEKEYRNKLKNAIWSSVPNLSVILATGNPYAAVAALATQVGIGYMNYRKNKNEAVDEKEKSMWQLQKSAIEQFNGIRRELFDASWRLSAKYEFPDEYRLTEKQIRQYNQILMDPNDIRRYERLSSISDNFEAYPYFWYYLGNAANLVSNDDQFEEKTKLKYKKLAIEHFKKFDEVDEISVLREDKIAASCYLEHAELLDAINDKKEIIKLLDKAQKRCGEECDVLQLCAMNYLKIGEYNKATSILRKLVVENYNQKTNAQTLSFIYINKIIMKSDEEACKNYESLRYLIQPNGEYLFPLPDNKCNPYEVLRLSSAQNTQQRIDNISKTIEHYIELEKSMLKGNWKIVIEKIKLKYKLDFEKCFPVKKRQNDDYYSDENKIQRSNDLEELISKEKKFKEAAEEIAFPDNIILLMNDLHLLLTTTPFEIPESLVKEMPENIVYKSLTTLVNSIYSDGKYQSDDIIECVDKLKFGNLTKAFFEEFESVRNKSIDEAKNFAELLTFEMALYTFCEKNNISLKKSNMESGEFKSEKFPLLIEKTREQNLKKKKK